MQRTSSSEKLEMFAIGQQMPSPLWKVSRRIHWKERCMNAIVKSATLLVVCLLAEPLVPAMWPQSTDSRTNVTDLVQAALSRNREYLALKQRVTETQALLRQAGLRPFPTVETEFTTGSPLKSSGEEEYSAGVFLPIETGGKRGKRKTVAQKEVELAEAELKEAQRQLVFDVKTRYVEALAAQAKATVLDQLMSASRQSYTLTEARVHEGDAPALEQKLLLADLNRSEAQEVDFKGRAESSLLELKKAVGLSPSEALPVSDLNVEAVNLATSTQIPPLPNLQKMAYERRPDLVIARILEEQGGAETNLQRAEGRPDLTASARYIHRRSQFPQLGLNDSGTPVPLIDKDNLLAFGLSIPLFTGSRTKGAVEAAVARQDAARLRREFLEANIPLEVEAAYRKWEAASHSMSLYASGVIAQSEQNLTVIRESYRLGQLRILDVLNEQRRLIDTQLAYVDAQTELAQAIAELERAVGGDLR